MRIWKTVVSTAILGLATFVASAHAQEMNDPFRGPALELDEGQDDRLSADLARIRHGASLGRRRQAGGRSLRHEVREPGPELEHGRNGASAHEHHRPEAGRHRHPESRLCSRSPGCSSKPTLRALYVIQVNMQGAVQTDAFVGPDLVGIGEEMANIVVNSCGKNGKSKKIAIVQGVLTGGVSFFEVQGVKKVLAGSSRHPGCFEPGGGLGCQQGALDHRDGSAAKSRSLRDHRRLGRPGARHRCCDPAGRPKGQGDADHRRRRRAEHVRRALRRNLRLRDQL